MLRSELGRVPGTIANQNSLGRSGIACRARHLSLWTAYSRFMPGDIRLAKGNPDAVFTAMHPNFYPDTAPYLLTGVELPPN